MLELIFLLEIPQPRKLPTRAFAKEFEQSTKDAEQAIPRLYELEASMPSDVEHAMVELIDDFWVRSLRNQVPSLIDHCNHCAWLTAIN